MCFVTSWCRKLLKLYFSTISVENVVEALLRRAGIYPLLPHAITLFALLLTIIAGMR